MRCKSLASVSTLIVALAMCGPALAVVKKAAITSPVRAGSNALLAVKVTPKARCTIAVIYDTVVSKAKGLGAKSGTKVTWRLRVGSNTHPGRWPVRVNCGKAGKLNVRLRVVP